MPYKAAAGRVSPKGVALNLTTTLMFITPILLTTVTTVAGLLPMAIGMTGYSPVFGPFATAIVFGLALASGLTLFVVPVLYLILDDLKRGTRRQVRRLRPGRTPAQTPLPGAAARTAGPEPLARGARPSE